MLAQFKREFREHPYLMAYALLVLLFAVGLLLIMTGAVR